MPHTPPVHRLRRGALLASGALLIIVSAGLALLRFLIANTLKMEGSAAVQESGYATIGGQQQWIEIRGWDHANPVLLWVHGGPGAPVLSATYSSFFPWERRFTIVQWHQRGAGLTYATTSTTAQRLTIDTMVQRRPDLFAAYVGTGQFTSLEDDGRDLFAAAMARATRDSNTGAIRALESVVTLPVTDVRRMNVVRRWGKTEDVSDNPLMLYLGLLVSPGYPLRHVFSFTAGFAKSRADLFEQELRVNMPRDVPELEIPAFLFQGRYDWQVSTPAAVRYFETLKAPVKEVVLFEGGHLVPMLQSDAFLKALVDKVRRYALSP